MLRPMCLPNVRLSAGQLDARKPVKAKLNEKKFTENYKENKNKKLRIRRN